MSNKKQKIELLLPAGHTDMAISAFEGGADAIYAGIDDFNARKKAKNFNIYQLANLIDYARKIDKKVYITLNTLIKNKEINKLLSCLLDLEQIKPHAIIIQDWGLYYLLKNFFPKIAIHASTQMGIHHSKNISYCAQKGFERVILSRELTFDELFKIQKDAQIQLEIFVHGALCYSFSGHCLFSSYLGGMSANRGLCKQPCRRLFNTNTEQKYLFSLKDLMLIDFIPKFLKMNISSLKIEGRLKSTDYVYNTARAYRMAIENPKRIDEAKTILYNDFAREKTSFFFDNNLKEIFTKTPMVGKNIGRISFIEDNGIQFVPNHDFILKSKIRIFKEFSDSDSEIIDVKKLYLLDEDDKYVDTQIVKQGNIAFIPFSNLEKLQSYSVGDQIYLINNHEIISIKYDFNKRINLKKMDLKKNQILKYIKLPTVITQNRELYLRVDHPEWLQFIQFENFDNIILSFTKKSWEDSAEYSKYIFNNSKKIFIELPLFISESNLDWYIEKITELISNGLHNYSLSQLSQKLMFKDNKDLIFMSNENIYLLNDIAIRYIQEEAIDNYIYPLENDIENMLSGNDRYGIVPMFFYPKLFYSRVPINLKQEDIISDQNSKYRKFIKEGMTVITTHNPVSWFQYKNKLVSKGFTRFLIDLSFCYPEKGIINNLYDSFINSESIGDSSKFNFKKGLW